MLLTSLVVTMTLSGGTFFGMIAGSRIKED